MPHLSQIGFECGTLKAVLINKSNFIFRAKNLKNPNSRKKVVVKKKTQVKKRKNLRRRKQHDEVVQQLDLKGATSWRSSLTLMTQLMKLFRVFC